MCRLPLSRYHWYLVGEINANKIAMLPSITWSMEWRKESELSSKQSVNESCKAQRKRGPEFWTHFKPLFQCALLSLQENDVTPFYCTYTHKVLIPWQNLPISVSPVGGGVPESRCRRKLIQVENMMMPAIFMINYLSARHHAHDKRLRKNLRVVEFCSGSGFIALPLAVLFPLVEFVLVDMKVLLKNPR